MALNFTGGRDISEESGADRTALWGEGLEIFKAHPLFGVGFGNMVDYTDDSSNRAQLAGGLRGGAGIVRIVFLVAVPVPHGDETRW